MVTFSELVETVEHLSQEEMEELRDILRKKLMEKRQPEILKASEEATREYEEGKTISVSSPEEIRDLFTDLMQKKEQEILEAVEEARKESAEGKTMVFSTPKEIKEYFEKILNNED